jgi:hypothetical protein
MFNSNSIRANTEVGLPNANPVGGINSHAIRANAEARLQDVYGRIIMPTGQTNMTNENLYEKMKNKIQYGYKQGQLTNNGSYTTERW